MEASYSHPFSLNEFEYGTYSENSLDLELSEEHIQLGKYAKPGQQMTAFTRHYELTEDGLLSYKMYLKMEGGEFFHHLDGLLQREKEE